MQFTRLRLNGFKSFVDPTDLVIQQGLTGVVGPNGCGKSNLLEALRWVMGESRPTAMRGGGMEDVIFAGTSRRAARNFAEVGLTIDNRDRRAPAGFNDSDHVEIVRRITRDAGSAYKAQGRDVRARDVQMLFADASTGAASPALVRQGQISELINAKPKARRRILEDAAGIAGLYQRRHEAELKLKAAEGNLARVDDAVEQLAAQLASLARQAKQAQRYRALADRLREVEALLLFRRWREAEAALAEAQAALDADVRRAVAAEAEARSAEAARDAADAAMPALREEDAVAAAIVQRLEVERAGLSDQKARAVETVARLEGRLRQLARDAERERGLNADADGAIRDLTGEAERLADEGVGHDDALARAAEESAAAAAVLGRHEGALAALTEDVARLAAQHQSATRMLGDARSARDRAARSLDAAREAGNRAASDAARAAAEAAEAEAALGAVTGRAALSETALAEAERARAVLQSDEAEARAALSDAESELGALAAERRALSKLAAREAGEDAPLMDRLGVRPGFEAALGAALADDLRAPVVETGSGWVGLPDYDAAQPLPGGAAPLTDAVETPGPLRRRLSQVGLVAAGDGGRMQAALLPGQRLVSHEGDLWRWDGFVVRAEDAPSAAALRMEQLNRLDALTSDVEAAEARAAEARTAHETVRAALATRVEAERVARAARKEADAETQRLSRRASQADANATLAHGRRETAEAAVARHEAELADAGDALDRAEAAVGALDDLDGLRAQATAMKTEVDGARIAMMTRRSAHDEVKRAGEARSSRLAAIEKELSGWRVRLDSAGGRLGEIASRSARTEAELATARAVPGEIDARAAKVSAERDRAAERRNAAADALAAGEAALRSAGAAARDAERAAGLAREARASAEARAEAAGAGVSAARERIAEALETTPEALVARLGTDPATLPPAAEIETEIAKLRRQRDSMGAVNLRAEEDADEVRCEHDALVAEKADLEQAIAELRRGIAGLNREGRERLLTAFEQVNANFETLFTHLFGGGEARLELVESDDPLDAGLEILCQPPGKKLSTLSLLSGGEQTLTAMALIFAVFLANPAPICVLDEVDAPLDDANVTRFCDMLDEMTRRTATRFLIITHHAVTMARMDRLFGVTMGEQGVSQLVSVDLKRAEAMVA